MNPEKAEEARRLMLMATAEVWHLDRAFVTQSSPTEWGVYRPTHCTMPDEIRWRSAQLACMQMGSKTECQPCWQHRINLHRARAPRDEQKAVRDQCCGMIGCPGPLVGVA